MHEKRSNAVKSYGDPETALQYESGISWMEAFVSLYIIGLIRLGIVSKYF